MTVTTLNAVADAVGVQPRTILRYATNDPCTYWAPGYDPDISVEKAASVLNCDKATLLRVLRGRDKFLKPNEAAKELNLSPRTFRHRKYTATLRRGGTVRYSRAKLINENLAKWVD